MQSVVVSIRIPHDSWNVCWLDVDVSRLIDFQTLPKIKKIIRLVSADDKIRGRDNLCMFEQCARTRLDELKQQNASLSKIRRIGKILEYIEEEKDDA